MSHYTVAVFTTDDDESIDDLLAPYDESIEVAPYTDIPKAEIIQNEKKYIQSIFEGAYTEWKKDPTTYEAKCANPNHIEYLKTIPDQMELTDEELYKQAIKGDEDHLTEEGDSISTYNPNSKWDWYEIGGRWENMLILKGTNHETCNAAFVRDIDFEAMRKQYLAKLRPYEEEVKDSYEGEAYMRKKYPTEEDYIKGSTAFSTYAVITPNGMWHAPGDMGWWGVSSETEEEAREWELNFHDRFIKPALKENWYMTIVDCHI